MQGRGASCREDGAGREGHTGGWAAAGWGEQVQRGLREEGHLQRDLRVAGRGHGGAPAGRRYRCRPEGTWHRHPLGTMTQTEEGGGQGPGCA